MSHEALRTALSDRYRIERELGQGGMAVVYLAHDLRHDRQVAIKVLHPEVAHLLGVDRFLAEIRTTAGLQHPGILPLFDSGSADGVVYYVMPYVEGESLRGRLQREGQLPVGDAVRIAADVAEALAYAHARGVIHRDIKPENILLQGGRPVLADFGIALAIQQAGGPRLTGSGFSVGTPQYMSPEQAAGERTVDGRTDLYALGSVLYEMLAGEPPFSAPTAQALIARRLSEEPRSLEALRKTTPPHIAAAVHRALELVPGDRFADAAAFARALREGEGMVPTPPGALRGQRSPARRASPLALAGVLVAGIGIGAIGLRLAMPGAASDPPPAVRFEIATDSAFDLVLSCCGSFFALSPDDRTVVFTARGAGDSIPRLYARDLGGTALHRLSGFDGFPQSPFFSADGKRLGFKAGNTLRSLPVAGGNAEIVAQLPQGYFGGATWTGDDRIVFAVRDLYAVKAGGGQPEVLLTPDSAKGEREFQTPHFVTGTDAVLFSVTRDGMPPEVRILWLGSKKVKPITQGAAPAYIARGRWLVTVRRDGQLAALPFDPAAGDTTGPAVRLVERVRTQSPVAAYAEYAVSPGGVIVRSAPALLGTGPQVNVAEPGRPAEALTLPIQAEYLVQPRFSPDGRRLAVLAAEPGTLLRSIYVYSFASKGATRLIFTEEPYGYGWTSGGDSLIAVTREGRVMIMPADRSEGGRVLGNLKGWIGLRSFVVHDRYVAFGGTGPVGGFTSIGVLARDSIASSPRTFAGPPTTSDDPAISPDGARMAWSSFEGARWEVNLSAFGSAGQRKVVSVGGGSEPRWSHDGRVLYYRQEDAVVAGRVEGPGGSTVGTPRPVVAMPRQIARGNWDVDPASGRVVWVRGEVTGKVPLLVEVGVLAGKGVP